MLHWSISKRCKITYKLDIISFFQIIWSHVLSFSPTDAEKDYCRQKLDFYPQYYYTLVAMIAKSAFLFQPFSHFLTASRSNHRLLLLLYIAPLECVKLFQSYRVPCFLNLMYSSFLESCSTKVYKKNKSFKTIIP